MASIINALSSGTGGIVTAGDASGILQLQTANTAAVTIDGSQNVGIGTASPGAKLDVQGTSDTTIRAKGTSGTAGGIFRADGFGSGSYPGFQLAQSGTHYWTIGQRGDTNLYLYRESGAGNVVLSAGTLQTPSTVSVGGATPSSSGAGITFPATQSASSNANTLDDYEEGSFNSALGGSGNSFTQTYNSYYTKIGNVVTVMIFTSWTAKSGSGGVTIDLPFPIGGSGRGGMSIGMITASTIISATKILYAQLDGGGTTVNLRYSNNSASWSGFTPAEMGSYGEIQIAGTYISS